MKKVYSVLDTKMGVFGNPIVEVREEAVIRGFSDAVNDPNPNNMWNKHPEDFALYYVGDFDPEVGCLIPAEKLRCVLTASAVKSVLNTNTPVPA